MHRPLHTLKEQLIRLLFFHSLAVLLLGCDSSESYLEGLNDGPTIGIVDVDNPLIARKIWQDSVKVSSPGRAFPYRFELLVEDFNANIQEVSIRDAFVSEDPQSGFLLFQYDTILVDLSVVGVNEAEQLITMEALVTGGSSLTLTFVSVDAFSQSDTAVLELTVFDNLLPVVNFEVQRDPSGSLVRRIDLSSSFDEDARHGGAISSYHWVIDETEFVLSQPFISHAFPSSGTFPVVVYVTDNNGSQSLSKSINVFIPL
ncbi:MAG: PKD domain-containing protein [Bacteroidota bacterium]